MKMLLCNENCEPMTRLLRIVFVVLITNLTLHCNSFSEKENGTNSSDPVERDDNANPNSDKSSDEAVFSVRCVGITVEGQQCKNNTNDENLLCHLHQDQETSINYDSLEQAGISIRCIAILDSGAQCKRRTRSASRKCYQHDKKNITLF